MPAASTTDPAVHDSAYLRAQDAELNHRIREAGGTARITVGDVFLTAPSGTYDAVIGNPPFIRYQDFTGPARARAAERRTSAFRRTSSSASE